MKACGQYVNVAGVVETYVVDLDAEYSKNAVAERGIRASFADCVAAVPLFDGSYAGCMAATACLHFDNVGRASPWIPVVA